MNQIAAVCREIKRLIRDPLPSVQRKCSGCDGAYHKGLLDFSVLIQPTEIAKYNYLSIPAKDTWGVISGRDNPLAAKPYAEAQDLAGLPSIFSCQVLGGESGSQ